MTSATGVCTVTYHQAAGGTRYNAAPDVVETTTATH
jgi:hypothetical protein